MHGENRVISACISAKQLDNFGTLWRRLGLCQWMMVLSSVEKVCVTWGATFWPPLHEFASQNRRTLHKFMRRGKSYGELLRLDKDAMSFLFMQWRHLSERSDVASGEGSIDFGQGRQTEHRWQLLGQMHQKQEGQSSTLLLL